MATSPNTGSASFLQNLTVEVEAVLQFVDILKREQAALGQGVTEELPVFAEQKSTLAVRLNNLATQRNAALAAQGLNADRSGVEAWCAKHPNEKNAKAIWDRILLLAGEAKELNRLNGELIQMRMQYNAKALEALMGGNKSLDLYGPDGQSTTPNNSRINDAV